MPEHIDEEIHPRLIETWKQFDEKVRTLDVQYDTTADEPLRQAFALPFNTKEDKAVWKGIADFMYETDNIKDGSVLLKVDPGYKKNEVLFSFTVATINDNRFSNVDNNLQERFISAFKSQPHITLNVKPTNKQNVNLDDAPDTGRLPEEDNIHKMPVEIKDKFNKFIMQDENMLKACRDMLSQCDSEIANTIEDMLKNKENFMLDLRGFLENM